MRDYLPKPEVINLGTRATARKRLFQGAKEYGPQTFVFNDYCEDQYKESGEAEPGSSEELQGGVGTPAETDIDADTPVAGHPEEFRAEPAGAAVGDAVGRTRRRATR